MSTPDQIRQLTLQEQGQGRPVLVLHGGAGPFSVAGFIEATSASAHVLAPTHPGFDGTPTIAGVETIADIAALYAAMLRERGLSEVLVVGFSVGGWIASELALQAPELLRGLVLANAVGIEVPGEPVADVFSLAPREMAALSWHAPDRFFVDPATFPPERLARMKANFQTLKGYGTLGREAQARQPGVALDAGLRGRLAGLRTPTLVAWGESDRIAPLAYGRAFAAAIPGARFAGIPPCGHLPQIEQPAALQALIREFDA